MFTPDQRAALEAKLNPAHVRQNPKGFDYVEGWWAIAEANRIFGFDGWDRQMTRLEQVGPPYEVNGNQRVAYRAVVQVRVFAQDRTIVRDGTGYGSGIGKDLNDAHESAVKEAETDAMKRALMTFGNPFGLALYDKTQANVGTPDQGRKSAAQAKRDGDHERIIEAIAACGDLEQLGAWSARFDEHTATLPVSWLDPMRDKYLARREELLGGGDVDGRAPVNGNGAHVQ